MPSACWTSRAAPPGKSCISSGSRGATVAGSNTTTSAAIPSSSRPRSVMPQMSACMEVSFRTPSSRVRSPRSRTYLSSSSVQ